MHSSANPGGPPAESLHQGTRQAAPATAARVRFDKSPAVTQEILCFTLALFIAVFAAPLRHSTHGFAKIFELRISFANLLVGGLLLVLWTAILRLIGPPLSHPGESTGNARHIGRLVLKVCSATAMVGIVLLIHHPRVASAAQLLLFPLLSFVFLLVSQGIEAWHHRFTLRYLRAARTVLIVGAGPRGQRVAQELQGHRKWNYELCGFFDPASPANAEKYLGSLDRLEAFLGKNPVDEVIIALPVKSMYDDIQRTIATCERVGVQCRYSLDFFQTSVTKHRSFDNDDPSSMLHHVVHDSGRLFKRVVDLAVAFTGLVFLSPVLLLIALCVKLTSKGPVLFRQRRYGLNRRLFTIYKFRSMVPGADKIHASLEHLNEVAGPMFKMKQDPRVTPLGRFLRATSLDELPQLWNVLIGEMSLVGPRPLPDRDVSRFSEVWLMRRFSVLPGITGLWQVSGRQSTNDSSWIYLDLDYIDRWSMLLDLQILLKTFFVVLRRDGAA